MTGWIPGYVPVRDLDEDSGGRVVLARRVATGTEVAVRYLSDELLADAEFRARFRGQADLLVELGDPHVVPLLEYVESDQAVAIITERLDAVPLRALLLEEGAAGPEAALVVLKDSLQALAAAGTRGVPHGDYKPENVLVTRAGGVKLANFGIVSGVAREQLSSSAPFYLAPELWESSATDVRGDLYAATATFFECMVGAPPYYATDPTALRRLHETAPAPVEAAPGPVRELVIHGMAKDPDERPATTEEFLEELEAVAAAGYGPAWERRGRGELARLAFPPPQPFPPGAGGAPLARKAGGGTLLDRVSLAAAGALILAIGLTGPMLSGDAPEGLGGPFMFGFGENGASSGAPAVPPPPPARLLGAPEELPAPGEPAGTTASPPAPAETEVVRWLRDGAPRSVETVIPPPWHSGTPMVGPLAPQTQVTKLSIVSFEHRGAGTRLVVRVDTTGTGPVQLILGYSGGPQGVPGTTSVQPVPTLTGSTSYSVTDDHDFSGTCTDYWHVFVTAMPPADNGEQSAEIPAVPCATPQMAPTPESAPPGTG